MAKITVISGSPSTITRLNGVIDYTIETLQKEHSTVNHIQVANLPAEDLLHANFASEVIQEAKALVEEADGVVIITPVYKGAYTGVLKAFLDLIPEKGLENKVILPIAMGGTTAHLLMLEYSLKPVVSILGATQIEHGVFVHDRLVARNEEGGYKLSEEVTNRLDSSLATFTTIQCENVTV